MDLFQIELMKLKRQRIWILVLIVPILGAFLGSFNYTSSLDILSKSGINEWYQLWNQVTFFYGLFLFPILSGLYAIFLCRADHLTGGWKQLFSLPVKRGGIFLSKLFLLVLLLLITQMMHLVFFRIAGSLIGLQEHMNINFFLKATINGWIAIFPVAAFQLILAIKTKSFMFSLSLNVLCTFFSLVMMILNLEQYYPWTLPSIAMASPTETGLTHSLSYFYILVFILSFMLYIWGNKTINKSGEFM
ncbi:ABC transporter permease [Lysinibacillus sp. NPDC096418]|uniref:ABC transporter permease n=1 Tax=Lysinibacillus sp. NPDC096418 TaxID=3364138 RepID=UPI00380B8DDE